MNASSQIEGRRQAYLAALAIPLWTVRHELSHAAAAPIEFAAYEDESVAVLVDEVAIVDEPSRIATKPVTPTPPVRSDSSEPPIYDDEPPLEAYLTDPEYQQAAVIDSFKQVLSPATTPSAAPVAVKLVSSEDQPVHFTFAVYACGSWQLLIPRSQLLSPSEAILLANIQRAMRKESTPPLLFTWPMVNNYAIPRHKKAAQEALVYFFNNQALSEKGYILLADYDDFLADIIKASTTKMVLIQPSLGLLLQQPQQKKALWLALNQ